MVYKNKIPTAEATAWGRHIDNLRLQRGWSKGELAFRCGFNHQSKISRIIQGEEGFKDYNVRVALARAFGITLDGLHAHATPPKKSKPLKTIIAVLIAASLALTCATGCVKKKIALVPTGTITIAGRR